MERFSTGNVNHNPGNVNHNPGNVNHNPGTSMTDGGKGRCHSLTDFDVLNIEGGCSDGRKTPPKTNMPPKKMGKNKKQNTETCP